jgi:Lysophospholipase L1 and related esterases
LICDLHRRHFILTAAAGALAGLYAPAAMAQKPAPVRPQVILVLGDSLSAEYGLPRGTGWVALLEKRLAQEEIAATVVNASVSGETTSGGRSRLAALLRSTNPARW